MNEVEIIINHRRWKTTANHSLLMRRSSSCPNISLYKDESFSYRRHPSYKRINSSCLGSARSEDRSSCRKLIEYPRRMRDTCSGRSPSCSSRRLYSCSSVYSRSSSSSSTSWSTTTSPSRNRCLSSWGLSIRSDPYGSPGIGIQTRRRSPSSRRSPVRMQLRDRRSRSMKKRNMWEPRSLSSECNARRSPVGMQAGCHRSETLKGEYISMPLSRRKPRSLSIGGNSRMSSVRVQSRFHRRPSSGGWIFWKSPSRTRKRPVSDSSRWSSITNQIRRQRSRSVHRRSISRSPYSRRQSRGLSAGSSRGSYFAAQIRRQRSRSVHRKSTSRSPYFRRHLRSLSGGSSRGSYFTPQFRRHRSRSWHRRSISSSPYFRRQSRSLSGGSCRRSYFAPQLRRHRSRSWHRRSISSSPYFRRHSRSLSGGSCRRSYFAPQLRRHRSRSEHRRSISRSPYIRRQSRSLSGGSSRRSYFASQFRRHRSRSVHRRSISRSPYIRRQSRSLSGGSSRGSYFTPQFRHHRSRSWHRSSISSSPYFRRQSRSLSGGSSRGSYFAAQLRRRRRSVHRRSISRSPYIRRQSRSLSRGSSRGSYFAAQLRRRRRSVRRRSITRSPYIRRQSRSLSRGRSRGSYFAAQLRRHRRSVHRRSISRSPYFQRQPRSSSRESSSRNTSVTRVPRRYRRHSTRGQSRSTRSSLDSRVREVHQGAKRYKRNRKRRDRLRRRKRANEGAATAKCFAGDSLVHSRSRSRGRSSATSRFSRSPVQYRRRGTKYSFRRQKFSTHNKPKTGHAGVKKIDELGKNEDTSTIFLPSASVEDHLNAQNQNSTDYLALIQQKSVSLSKKTKVYALAASWSRHDFKLSSTFLGIRESFGFTEVLKAIQLLDSGRKIRQTEKKIKRLQNYGSKVSTKKILELKGEIKSLKRLKPKTGSVNSSVCKHVRTWVRTLTKEELEHFALCFSKEPWKKLASICHLHPEKDFPQLPWFLPYCYGEKAPPDSVVYRCRNLNKNNVNSVIKQHSIPYCRVKRFKRSLTDETKARLASSESKLDNLLLNYEDLSCPKVDWVIMKRLHAGEIVNLPLGTLLGLLFTLTIKERTEINRDCTSNYEISFKESLTSVTNSMLQKVKINQKSPMVIFGDRSLKICTETSYIIAVILNSLCSAELFFADKRRVLPRKIPSNVNEMLYLACSTTTKLTAYPAVCLWPFYQKKKIVKVFIVMTDGFESGTCNGNYFSDLFEKYYTEVYPAKIVIVSILDQNRQNKIIKDLKDKGLHPVELVLDPRKPDLSKLDCLFATLATEFKSSNEDLSVL